MSVGLEKYVVFPPGLDFSSHLGERGIQREAILEGLPDLIAEMAHSQGKVTPMRKGSDHRDGSQIAMKIPSTRRAREMEDTMGRSETEHPMDVGARSEAAGAQEDHMQADEPAVSYGLMKSKRSGRFSRQAGEGPSPSRQAAPPRQRTHEGPSSTNKRRLRVDPESSEEDVPSQTKRKPVPITTGSFVGSPSSRAPRQKSPSKSRATTPLPGLDSDLVPPIGSGEESVPERTPWQSSAMKMKTRSPVKARSKGTRVPRSESTSEELSGAPPSSSPTADTTLDREEDALSRRTSRRSAANKATQRLREEVMPDVVNFEKEMRRGQVRVANLSPKSGRERGQEKIKTRLLAKPLSKGKKRPSTQPATAVEDVGSSDECENEGGRLKKRRRLSRAKSHHGHIEDSDDDDHTDITGISSQGTAAEIPSSKSVGGKGAKAKGNSQSGQVDSFHSFFPHWQRLMI